jgi:hypothetical protein
MVWCLGQIGEIVTIGDRVLTSSGGFPELGAEDVSCHHYGPGCLVHRGPAWLIPRHEEAQFRRIPAQRVKRFEAFYKPLAAANVSEPSGALESIADGDMTASTGWVV